jgi:hypothetical protein
LPAQAAGQHSRNNRKGERWPDSKLPDKAIFGLLGWNTHIDSVEDTAIEFSDLSGKVPSSTLPYGGSLDCITGLMNLQEGCRTCLQKLL